MRTFLEQRVAKLMYQVELLFGLTGGATQQSGLLQVVRFPVGTATTSSLPILPSDAVIFYAGIDVRTPWSPGTGLQVGRAGSPALLMDTPDSIPGVVNLYDAVQDTEWGATPAPVLFTVTGGPVAGAGFCAVKFALV